MPTVTNPGPRYSDTSTVERNHVAAAETSVDQAAAVQLAEELVRVPAPVLRPNLLVRLVRILLAFDDWLSGPPIAKRDRVNRDIAEAEPKRYIGPMDFKRP